jgi:DNA (cytosine-5)-methyltransferase 1
MRYLSLCSGIEAASVAWEPLGWKAAALSEIEPFPCAVLAHRYPDVPNLGDMTAITELDLERIGPINLLVGGTPCQSFSVAGRRGGLNDVRGQLALSFATIAGAAKPRWVVWENVPGVLTADQGWAFAAFIRGLVELGYRCAWRVLDAQFFGVPQRRRRVFVVGHLGGDGARSVLLERDGGEGHPAQGCGETNRDTSRRGGGADQGGGGRLALFGGGASARRSGVPTLTAHQSPRYDLDAEAFVVHLCQNPIHTRGISLPLSAGDRGHAVGVSDGVRRLMPIETERLQGFPDNWTRIPWRDKPVEQCPDGHRYKACGNSMAVPVMRWIGERIAAYEAR